jgi:hypothetical protein
MKNINKIAAFALASVALSSCHDLDTEYFGAYVTEDQKTEAAEQNPDVVGSASVNGIFSAFSSYMSISSNHYDFGYPAVMLGLDMQTADVIAGANNYNWFSSWQAYSNPSPTGVPTGMMWYTIYDQLYVANAVLMQYGENVSEDKDVFFRANALAMRAFDYWVLAQLYQFNYEGHESSPCVPIITDKNQEDAAANGCARATVQEVYDQILSDLNESIALFSKTSYTREDAMDSKPKRMIDISVAYGLRARVNLTMHKYAAAAEDAQLAINHFGGSPYSRTEVSTPGFNDIDDDSWMWGIAIAETDRVVTSGIVNWPSMMCTFAYGYVTVGAWKYCDANLYSSILNSDVRKGWFLDANLKSSHLSTAQQNYINSYSTIPAYTNVKFDSYRSELNQSTSANDIPLMRIEEMYYILAEGQAMSGQVEQGLTTFQNFIRKYRNPSYYISTNNAEALQEAIYQDRRVEFWGEGLAYFDIMRLNKSVDRRDSNHPSSYAYYIPGVTESPELAKVLIYCIPSGEVTANSKISTSDNNPSGEKPTSQG